MVVDVKGECRVMPAGEFEAVTLPDTLDLADNARLAVHGVLGNVDPDLGPEMWFLCSMDHKTGYMKHLSSDNACSPKYGELLPLMRLMSGSDEALGLEARMRRRLLDQIEEGIFWNKAEPERPWWCMYMWDKDDKNPKGEDLSSPVGQSRMMRTLMTWREVEDTVTYTWNKRVPDQERQFTFHMRGSTCVAAPHEPFLGPSVIPFYQREHMRSDQAPMRAVQRFRPERVFRDW